MLGRILIILAIKLAIAVIDTSTKNSLRWSLGRDTIGSQNLRIWRPVGHRAGVLVLGVLA